jgi:hypothetical protein
MMAEKDKIRNESQKRALAEGLPMPSSNEFGVTSLASYNSMKKASGTGMVTSFMIFLKERRDSIT